MKYLLTESLGIDCPFIQAPMAGALKSPDFVAQISNFGMLAYRQRLSFFATG